MIANCSKTQNLSETTNLDEYDGEKEIPMNAVFANIIGVLGQPDRYKTNDSNRKQNTRSLESVPKLRAEFLDEQSGTQFILVVFSVRRIRVPYESHRMADDEVANSTVH